MSTSSVKKILLDIRDEHGALTPRLVTDVARSPKHPLHHRFEWDNRVAGDKYRLQQAAELIRSVRISFETDDGPKDLRAWQAVRGEDTPTSEYVPTEEALADPFTRQLLLRQFKRDWQAFRRRYEHLAEFAEQIRRDIEGQAS